MLLSPRIIEERGLERLNEILPQVPSRIVPPVGNPAPICLSAWTSALRQRPMAWWCLRLLIQAVFGMLAYASCSNGFERNKQGE